MCPAWIRVEPQTHVPFGSSVRQGGPARIEVTRAVANDSFNLQLLHTDLLHKIIDGTAPSSYVLLCRQAKEFVRLQAADDRALLEEYKRLEIPTQASDSESCRYTPHSWNSARKVPSIVSGSYGSIPKNASRKQRVQAETPTKRRELLQRLQRVAAWRARSLGCEEGRSLEFS